VEPAEEVHAQQPVNPQLAGKIDNEHVDSGRASPERGATRGKPRRLSGFPLVGVQG
jgi:hypothetical protein